MIAGKLVTKPILLACGMNEFFVKNISDLKSDNPPDNANNVLR